MIPTRDDDDTAAAADMVSAGGEARAPFTHRAPAPSRSATDPDSDLIAEIADCEDARSRAIARGDSLAIRRLRHELDGLEVELRRRRIRRGKKR